MQWSFVIRFFGSIYTLRRIMVFFFHTCWWSPSNMYDKSLIGEKWFILRYMYFQKIYWRMITALERQAITGMLLAAAATVIETVAQLWISSLFFFKSDSLSAFSRIFFVGCPLWKSLTWQDVPSVERKHHSGLLNGIMHINYIDMRQRAGELLGKPKARGKNFLS